MTTHGSKPPKALNFLKILIPAVILVLISVGALSLVKKYVGKSPTHSEFGEMKEIDDLELYRIDGQKLHLSEFKSKIIMINFWASWCEACLVEIPSILKLHESFAPKGFEVIFLNIEDNPQALVPPIAKKLGIPFPVFFDKNQKISDIFDVHGIPFTVILDAKRKILMIETGERDWNSHSMRRKLEEWVK